MYTEIVDVYTNCVIYDGWSLNMYFIYLLYLMFYIYTHLMYLVVEWNISVNLGGLQADIKGDPTPSVNQLKA